MQIRNPMKRRASPQRNVTRSFYWIGYGAAWIGCNERNVAKWFVAVALMATWELGGDRGGIQETKGRE